MYFYSKRFHGKTLVWTEESQTLSFDRVEDAVESVKRSALMYDVPEIDSIVQGMWDDELNDDGVCRASLCEICRPEEYREAMGYDVWEDSEWITYRS